LAPVDFEDAVRQVGDRDEQCVTRVVGQMLDAMVNQCHQRGEFVGCRPQSCLKDRDNALTEKQRVRQGIGHIS
jgi:hypothetical protein